MKKFLSTILILYLGFSILISCHFAKLERNLSPDDKEFLSKVRYIITKKEKEVFFNLPFPERGKFIEEFWKRRDPDPDTEINEFKEQYFHRIEEANRLFKEGGTPGWLQDRGRIYILLGPPEAREKYPTGYTFYGRPMEIWYYGPYPIIFIDYSYVGDYELYPLSAQHMAELLKAQMDLKPKVQMGEVIFDFALNLKKMKDNQLIIQIKVPYKNIWLVEKDDRLETTLVLSLEIFNNLKRKIWNYQKNYFISLNQDEVVKTLSKNYLIEVQVTLSKDNYTMSVSLENKTDEQKVEKTIKFSL
ncbi:MAG: GWxTD domain-containing protein [Candidatus Aminicenantia bacterium]